MDGGSCAVGLESTVLDLTTTPPVLLRPGAVLREEIEFVLGYPIRIAEHPVSATPTAPDNSPATTPLPCPCA